jgi:hypothetical protein
MSQDQQNEIVLSAEQQTQPSLPMQPTSQTSDHSFFQLPQEEQATLLANSIPQMQRAFQQEQRVPFNFFQFLSMLSMMGAMSMTYQMSHKHMASNEQLSMLHTANFAMLLIGGFVCVGIMLKNVRFSTLLEDVKEQLKEIKDMFTTFLFFAANNFNGIGVVVLALMAASMAPYLNDGASNAASSTPPAARR